MAVAVKTPAGQVARSRLSVAARVRSSPRRDPSVTAASSPSGAMSVSDSTGTAPDGTLRRLNRYRASNTPSTMAAAASAAGINAVLGTLVARYAS